MENVLQVQPSGDAPASGDAKIDASAAAASAPVVKMEIKEVRDIG